MNQHRNGPVRSAAAREAVLAATTRLFHEQGYDKLTIEGIAREAGVGKQTIYRWWSSRGAVIADCLAEGRLFPVEFEVPDSGQLLPDIEHWLSTVLAVLDARNGGELVRSLVAAAAEDPAVGTSLSERLGVERSLAARLERAVHDGQLPANAPIDQIGESILGAIIVRALSRQSDSGEPLRRLVRFLFAPSGPARR
ncbi:TetR/AcrR family transcriptional regulator [Microterricola viridarii]|uniref:DNA-binding transcriptional regulator, AcrR family n=1 Tax=Microterricola viridarii TaxID=412690 RepID=A0A1H1WI11_9MICO|nr:TetR/AcrR family transcriptional regulator [Microterricola viridarii]SDS96734.1 DNA-binding transcriptional regulator, AcrR family [Microterricola viridarii]